MSTKRLRNGKWAYTVKNSQVLDRPIYLTFDDEEEGDKYVAHLEKLLDKGYVPEEFQSGKFSLNSIADAIDAYETRSSSPVPESDKRVLKVTRKRVGSRALDRVDYEWAEDWVASMKMDNLSPSTIRHHVGALARCFDWVVKKRSTMMVNNPLRMLPKGYSTGHKEEHERDHRLDPEHEEAVLRILNGIKPDGRALELKHREALRLIFIMGLESGMRMKEMHTLETQQIDFELKTIFLEKTKNGSKRQVPMTTVVIRELKNYLKDRKEGKLFPWEGDGRAVTALLSQQFGRIFDAAGYPEFTFHGLRHEATCRLYERTKLSDIQIAKILGWRSLKVALRYANLRGSTFADALW